MILEAQYKIKSYKKDALVFTNKLMKSLLSRKI
jgi:hypothetical protein